MPSVRACIPEFQCDSALVHPGAYGCSPLWGLHVLMSQLPGSRRKERYIFPEGPKAIIQLSGWNVCLACVKPRFQSRHWGCEGESFAVSLIQSERTRELKTCLATCSPSGCRFLGASFVGLVWFFEKGSVDVAQASLDLLGSSDLLSFPPGSWGSRYGGHMLST